MKKVCTVYQVEVSATEVYAIVDSLHERYMALKSDEVEKGCRDYNERLEILRSTRNGFAALVNRSFMGADA